MKVTNLKNYRLGIWRRHLFSILVWAVAVAAVVGLFYKRSERFEVLGIAQGRMHQISAPVDGRLKIVSIELFEKVDNGQILAIFDDAQLNAQIATIHTEIEHLMSQLVSTQDSMLAEEVNLETNWIAAQRRFSVDVENARLRILELKTLLETDRIMLEELALEVKITQELLDENAVADYQLQKVKLQFNTLSKKFEENQHLLNQAECDFKLAQQRQSEFAQNHPFHPSVERALDVIRKQIAVQERLIAELSVQREALRIISPVDGMVVQIQVNANQATLRRPGENVLRRPGEVVLAGDPILVVAETEPTEIIAYASGEQMNQIREGIKVELIKSTEPAQISQSQVSYVGPVIEEIPIRLWLNPNIPQWGRPFLVKIPPQMKLTPGELIGIRRL